MNVVAIHFEPCRRDTRSRGRGSIRECLNRYVLGRRNTSGTGHSPCNDLSSGVPSGVTFHSRSASPWGGRRQAPSGAWEAHLEEAALALPLCLPEHAGWAYLFRLHKDLTLTNTVGSTHHPIFTAIERGCERKVGLPTLRRCRDATGHNWLRRTST
eukprot:scaffold175_cov414-Prasinococcus_capsulatus_cf.AAC.49